MKGRGLPVMHYYYEGPSCDSLVATVRGLKSFFQKYNTYKVHMIRDACCTIYDEIIFISTLFTGDS